MLRSALSIVIVWVILPVYAAHIVGGEMFYQCLGNNDYQITLKLYRDCNASGPSVADYDNPAFIGIYNGSGNLTETVEAFLNARSTIPAETNDPCVVPPPGLCVEVGTYTFQRNLPPVTGGYDIVYIRCCRNATIVNLVAPGDNGAIYSAHIPGPSVAVCNSSPYFVDFPPIVICANEALIFDHSAIDPDGDVLVYELCHPYSGATSADPQPAPTFSLPTFGFVNWRSPYNTTNPIAASPQLSINASTGLLTGTPNSQGQFVVGVCVKEYRAGVLIGETKRDFQFNVTQCLVTRAIIPVIDTVGAGATGTVGHFARQCDGYDVQFVNQSINGTTYFWDFGDTTSTTDVSTAFQPTYTYPDTGVYIATLIVNPGGFSCSDTTKVIVRIYPIFDTDFNFFTGCALQPALFTDQTIANFGNINSWNWNFGDGNVSNLENPQHTFSQGGTYTVNLVSTSDKGCRDIKTRTVIIDPVPKVDFNFNPPCINSTMIFNDNTTILSGNIASWSWDLGNGFSSVQNPQTSYNSLDSFSIKLIVISDKGCVDSIQKTIRVHPLPMSTVRSDTVMCQGDRVQLWASGGNFYSWNPVAGLDNPNIFNPNASPVVTTAYEVTVTDSNGCQDKSTVNVQVNPLPPTYAGTDSYVCEGNSYQLNGSGGSGFLWMPGNMVSDSTIANPTTSPSNTTTFFLTSFSLEGCKNHDSVTIEVQHPINMTVSADQEICQKDLIDLVASGGIYYKWTPLDGSIGSNTAPIYNVSPESDITYKVVVSNDCFADSGLVQVKVYELPVADAGENDNIRRDEFVNLNGSGGGEYLWAPSAGLDDPTSPNTQASPFNTTDYVLTVRNEFGCLDQDTVTIFVEVVNLIAIPSAFTPNQDGVNDIFRIIKSLNIDHLIEFKIFNRWGALVFETTDLQLGWDGTYKGVAQDMGTFAYIVRAQNWDGEIVESKGSVTLIR